MKTLQYIDMKTFSMAIIIMYAPWQRGLDENSNGQYRRFLPEDKSSVHLTDNKKMLYIILFNAKLRKC
ncbi:MAG TPA: hypothetical protein PLH80_08795 [Spirochaetota bacterium]|jgi:IS30 family transposase|nr:hypothetical protein [Spirochaetota bacterium]HOM86687.1 hypothetical protein [Spirochaetota bacterium]HOR93164.1 hypothetical protein [Spirochaetota bacterium]HQI38644.1 hypothetical protein [Spirochaetota bacterium]HQK06689.1 hypothetical protein [Spirochaetota bacterium]